MGAIFAIFFLALLLRTLLWVRAIFESKWASYWYETFSRHGSDIAGKGKQSVSRSVRPFRMQVEVPRMLLVFVTAALGYALMLITMTFVVVSTQVECYLPR